MAAIDDLITQVDDEPLRARLQEELERLTKEKKFGLVFEEHLPELTPIYSASIRLGSTVARRNAPLAETWRVQSIADETATCRQGAHGEEQKIPVDDLVVVRRFGEPIYPSLLSVDRVQNGPADAPWHTLIEADNYHALQLLEYLCAGQVDCIYVDPPYNTGARDWKYNNDYVDVNDRWRHSKWLAMMRRRLILAKRMLNPRTGVLIVTIDEHEVHHLGMLLEQTFPECSQQMVTIVINQKGVSQGRLARVEEYAIFVFMPECTLQTHHDDLLSADVSARNSRPRWERLLRGGNNSRRDDRPGLFYPIYIDPDKEAITGVGEVLPLDEIPDLSCVSDRHVAWPIRTDGSFGNWQLQPSTLMKLHERGYVRLGGFHKQRGTWTVLYLNRGTRARILSGEIHVVSRNEVTGAVDVEYASAESRQRNLKTVWHRSTHDSGIYGSGILRKVVGPNIDFSFPKSVYSVRDAISAIVRGNPKALLLDFFAGSGTTLHAVAMANAIDEGSRTCILVTNNEVADDQSRVLAAQGFRPGDSQWELQGICQAVTWPRCKYTFLGRRDDGTEIEGDYLTGGITLREKPRTFRQLGFVDADSLDTAARKRELAGVIEGVPMSHIDSNTAFFVSEDQRHTAALLFDDSQADAFLEALEEMGHITHFYVVTRSAKLFNDLKAAITDLLGPVEVLEDERRPMREGFAANLEYFRLGFLEKDEVALGRQFREILPLLWLRAGANGPRPELAEDEEIPTMLLPESNPFAVLVDETRFAEFQQALSAREDVTHVYLVTDSEEAYQEMAAQLTAPHVIQLYRDYLENFAINRGDAT